MTMRNPWAGFLEEDPAGRQGAYFSRRNQFGGPDRSQRQENYFQNSFTDLYQEYLGTLAQQIRGGSVPTNKWDDYLGQFDFSDWYRRQVPYQQRTQGFSGLVPQIQWRV